MRALAVVLFVTVGCYSTTRYRADTALASVRVVRDCFASCDRLLDRYRPGCLAQCPAVIIDHADHCPPADDACRIEMKVDAGKTILATLGGTLAFAAVV